MWFFSAIFLSLTQLTESKPCTYKLAMVLCYLRDMPTTLAHTNSTKESHFGTRWNLETEKRLTKGRTVDSLTV